MNASVGALLTSGNVSSVIAYLGVVLYFILTLIYSAQIAANQEARNHLFVANLIACLALMIYFWVQFLEMTFAVRFWRESLLGILMIPGCLYLISARPFILENARAAQIRADKFSFNKMKDEFLTVASHELRTPLSVINGFAEILVREKLGPLNDEQKRRVRKILLQGQRLNRILDELLDLNRIRSGKVEIKKWVFDLVPVLRACFDDHVILCEQQHISFEARVPDVLPDVSADIDRTTQVIVNLLNNAIKYTPAGGSVVLEAAHEEGSAFITVSIRDTGIGIAPEEQPLIFNEFFRSTQSTSKKYAGSGLGLAIVKQLVESQGGKVTVESAGLNEGCSFSFTIPTAPVSPSASVPGRVMPPSQIPTPHVPQAKSAL